MKTHLNWEILNLMSSKVAVDLIIASSGAFWRMARVGGSGAARVSTGPTTIITNR